MERAVVVGASRGIGAAVARHLEPRVVDLISVARGASVAGRAVRADVATDAGLDAVVAAVGDRSLDALLFMGGTWESGAFTAAYRFLASPREEARQVIAVNLLAPILLVQSLAPALAKAAKPRVVIIGALSGRDGAASPEVANTASKFGLRGAAQAMALTLRPMGIGISLIHPGNVATEEVESDIAEGRFGSQVPIPMADLLATIDHVLALSGASVPIEIDLVQMRGA